MPIPLTVPRLGWSTEEATFVGWLKKPGELVRAGEPLFTLESEKASQEIEASDSGVLRVPPNSPQPGDIVKVGALLGYLDGEKETKPTETQTAAPTRQEPVSAATSAPSAPAPVVEGAIAAAPARAGRPAASPRARRRAAELGVDWTRLKGSGRTGRIVESDVLEASRTTAAAPLTPMRRLIAQRTAESFAAAPHFYLRAELDATALLQLRQRLVGEIERSAGVRLTLTDLILRAQARALRQCPFANCVWRDNGIVACPGWDVGLVVSLPEGLLIPIVRSAAEGGVPELARRRAALVEAARAGRLAGEALQGGATSLSNLGKSRVDEFSAVIPSGQSSVLAVGRVAPRPFVVDEQFVLRPTLKLCLSVDHRVMDGGPAAEFLGRIVDGLEQPETLV